MLMLMLKNPSSLPLSSTYELRPSLHRYASALLVTCAASMPSPSFRSATPFANSSAQSCCGGRACRGQGQIGKYQRFEVKLRGPKGYVPDQIHATCAPP